MASEESRGDYTSTYREQDVDDTLDDHERRLTRLEKAAYIGAGYIVGMTSMNSADIVQTAMGLI